jgi:hypothetical protein
MMKNKKALINRQGKNRLALRNKKAWIRIVEAFTAVMIIAIFLITLYSSQVRKTSKELVKLQDLILDEVVQNNQLRTDIMNGNYGKLNNFVGQRIPPGLSFSIKICEVDAICNPDKFMPELYAGERIVSSSLKEYHPKRLRLFMWKD